MPSVKVHPLAEIIAKRLFGIWDVPATEQRKMISRACKAAIEYHEKEMSDKSEVKPYDGISNGLLNPIMHRRHGT